jgi:hypothetical protein
MVFTVADHVVLSHALKCNKQPHVVLSHALKFNKQHSNSIKSTVVKVIWKVGHSAFYGAEGNLLLIY